MKVFRSGNAVLLLAATVLGSTVAAAQTVRDPRYHRQDPQDQQGQQGQQGQRGERGEHDRNNDQRDSRWTQQQQQARIDENRRRQSDYERVLDQRMRDAREQQAHLQQQRRMAAYEEQQRYYAHLQAQRARMRSERDYNIDPYYDDLPTYSYRVGNTIRVTSEYGADLLEQAVTYGYDQGVHVGRADRLDRRVSSYRSTFAYQDANYGYAGQYVSQNDYNYFFREGFRRGYTDGYGSRSQYGSFNNGSGSILANVLSGILGLTNLR